MAQGLPTTIVGLAMVLMLGGNEARASAPQTFKDEAGRIIYAIDADGTVSMFENSPTDLTISVTRGTREQMQPQVTEVMPQSITAGTSPMVKLKGRNLVGATIIMSVPQIEVSAYVAKPKNLDLTLHVPATVPPGKVILQIATPIGKTTASLMISEMQIGSGAVHKGGPEKPIVSSAAPACPDGMMGVSAELGGFCIDLDRSFTGEYGTAEKTCSIAKKRLCQAQEWQHACEQAQAGRLAVKNMIGSWEWTGSWDSYQQDPNIPSMDFTPEIRSILMGQVDCRQRRVSPRWKAESFVGRCCK